MNARNTSEGLFWTLILLSAFLIMSCSKEGNDSTESEDYLIFGKFAGFCVGEECVETFKLTRTQLFEDRSDKYLGNGDYDFEELSMEMFNRVKGLIDEVPSKLLNEESQTFGCPDCYDQGGYLVEIPQDGEIKSWRIDTSIKDIPEYLHEFVQNIQASIVALNN